MTETTPKRKQTKPSREQVFQLRLTEAEHTELKTRAERAGLSIAGLIRRQCLDQKPPRASRRPTTDQVALVRVLAELGKVGSNVNQIAHALNAGGAPIGMVLSQAQAVDDVAAMRRALMEALGLDGD